MLQQQNVILNYLFCYFVFKRYNNIIIYYILFFVIFVIKTNRQLMMYK